MRSGEVHVCVAVRARAIVAAFDRCGSGVSVVQNVRLKMCAMCGSKNINRKLLYTSLDMVNVLTTLQHTCNRIILFKYHLKK